ncbi:SDR family oxidoreductase [Gordonia sinesedis]
MTLRDRLIGNRAASDRNRSREVLSGKVIALTGGARGIGYETAFQLTEAGARVAIGDIDGEAVGKAAADLGIDGLELDVTDSNSIEAFLSAVESRLGPIDVLVNNAGIMPVGSFLAFDDTMIRSTLDIDLFGVIVGSRAAARRMVDRGHGQIVNVASIAGRLPMPGLAVYNAAKAGVIEFSEALDAELTPAGVRVSTVMPTFTRTGLIAGLKTNRFIQVTEPEQVAAAVVGVIVRPRTRVFAPRAMRWVDANTTVPQGIKRLTRRITDLDTIFLDYDHAQRAEYAARMRGSAR